MRLFARSLNVLPRLLELATRLDGLPGRVVLSSGFHRGAAWGGGVLACDPLEERSALDPETELELAPSRNELAVAPRWIGLLPYEHFRPLERGRGVLERRAPPPLASVRWLRYGAVALVSDTVLVVGDDARAVQRLARQLERPAPLPSRGGARGAEPCERGLISAEAPAKHEARIRAALELIAAGELYQVNLARRFELAVERDALEVWRAMTRSAPSAYGACFQLGDVDVVSTSPELFLRLEPDRRMLTAPIKGTRPRGGDAVEDLRLMRELDADEKERAELSMVLDVERNDLGRVAVAGSVRLIEAPRVSALGPVHHRLATVGARLRADSNRSSLFSATLPSGSVTGAPKIRAMEVIASLEAERRGLYTGAYGAICHDGGVVLGMAIRTLVRVGTRGLYFAGGGIVADSQPAREVRETEWKARQLHELITGAPAARGPV